MTSYLNQSIAGPVISSLVSKEKGDFSNRTSCAGAQLVNNAQALAADTVVIGGTALGANAIRKNEKLTAKIAKMFDNVVKKLSPIKKRNITLVGESGKPFHTFEMNRSKLAQKLLNKSAKGKAALALVLPALAAVGFITRRQIYRMGQIDQKYTDKAAIKKHQEEVIK